VNDVAVILIGLNASHYVRQALQSLLAAEWHNCTYELIYVDNGSRDNTREMLTEFPQVRTILNDQNLGFCKAGNQGASIADSRYLFFLNDDTIVLDDAVVLLKELLDRTPGAGVAGSRLLYPDMSEQWSGRRFATPINGIFGRRSLLSRLFPNAAPVRKYVYKDEVAVGVPFVVDWVSAAAMMVRQETFDKIGGLAEDYYYFHESIFCDRIHRAGLMNFLHPQSRIIHYEGKGSGSRPLAARIWHVKDFHRGAYRFYCEQQRLTPRHPRRYVVAGFMSARALALVAGNGLAYLRQRMTSGTRKAA
jgi:N-acetylglucosaminyl-diphospho-decaprenol L-rhamnosyltransferase